MLDRGVILTYSVLRPDTQNTVTKSVINLTIKEPLLKNLEKLSIADDDKI